MSIVARLDLDRSDRVAVARETTLRNNGRAPTDVVLDNLSATGCLITLDFDLAMNSVVSVGIPGVGACFARIVRCDRPNYGCEFLTPITHAEIAAAQSVDTVVQGAFPRHVRAAAVPAAAPAASDAREPGLPVAGKVTIILGASAMLWAALITSVVLVAR